MKCKTCDGRGFSTPKDMGGSKMCKDCKGSGKSINKIKTHNIGGKEWKYKDQKE